MDSRHERSWSPTDPDIQATIEELKQLVRDRYPDTQFKVFRGEDPDGMYLVPVVDIDDLGEVVDVFLPRMVELQVEGGLPVYVVPDQPLERVVARLRAEQAAAVACPVDPVTGLARR